MEDALFAFCNQNYCVRLGAVRSWNRVVLSATTNHLVIRAARREQQTHPESVSDVLWVSFRCVVNHCYNDWFGLISRCQASFKIQGASYNQTNCIC